MVFGLVGSILGIGGGDTSQETSVDIVNENFNQFSPEVIINNTVSGLDTLGEILRGAFTSIAGSNNAQTASIDQAGLNIAGAIDGAGVNITQGLLTSSETLSGGISSVGANIGFAIIAGVGIAVVGGQVLRA